MESECIYLGDLFETYLAIVSDEGHSLSRITRRTTKETLFYPHVVLQLKFLLNHNQILQKIYLVIYRNRKNNVVYINKYNENRQTCYSTFFFVFFLKSQQLNILMGSTFVFSSSSSWC